MAVSQRPRTLEAFLELPEETPALEFFHGRVVQKVSPKGPHSTLQPWLAELFNGHARPRRLGAAFTEARVTFCGQSTVPDLVYYCWERIPRTPEGRVAEDFTTPPDIAIEILSPGQSAAQLGQRCEWYVANGVRVALFVDPRRELARLFRPGLEPTLISGDEGIELEELLPGFRLTARQIFDALDFR